MGVHFSQIQPSSWGDRTPSFSREHIFEPAQLCVLVVAIIMLVVCGSACVFQCHERLRRLRHALDYRTTQDTSLAYSAEAAWLQATTFFSLCIIASWSAGVLDAVVFHPTLPLASTAFYVFTAACFLVVILGYWLLWPMGTVTYGRRRARTAAVVFGLLDGFCESQLFMCIWALVELTAWPRWGVATAVFFLQGGFKANWDQRYWNVHVAPAHNIDESDKWKVLFVHLPNVVVTFSHFVTYGSAWLYVISQIIALLGSTTAMRFPSPWSRYTNPPRDTQIALYRDKSRAAEWDGSNWSRTLSGQHEPSKSRGAALSRAAPSDPRGEATSLLGTREDLEA